MPIHHIPCSYGELVDKWTILNIKKSKCPSEQTHTMGNILKEQQLLEEMIIDKHDLIVLKLQQVNAKLWDLEDQIRNLSQAGDHGPEFIKCAEQIHIVNDTRYSLKKELNDKYDSDIKEEKIYTKNGPEQMMMHALKHFPSDVPQCYQMLKHIKDHTGFPITPFGVNLYMNYLTALNFLGITDPELPSIDWIMTLIKNGTIRDTKYQSQIALELLRVGCYKDSYPYLPYLHAATGPNGIKPESMQYFKPGDKDKTMIVYSSGGLGDIIMFSRLVPLVCKRNPSCNIVYLVDSRLEWLMKASFKDIDNLEVKAFTVDLPKFDYHYNINALMAPLNITLDSNLFPIHMANVHGSGRFQNFMNDLGEFALFGWKGSESNQHEIHNRRVPLDLLLEKLHSDNKTGRALVTVQRDITETERALLQKYKVHILSDQCQEQEHAFYDTIDLVRNASLVISSDTALLHLAGSVRPAQWDDLEQTITNTHRNTIGLITKGCDWRWNTLNRDLWYPIVTVIQQTVFGSWGEVLSS